MKMRVTFCALATAGLFYIWGLSLALGASASWTKANQCFKGFNYKCAIASFRKALGEIPPQLTKKQQIEGYIKLSRSYFTEGDLKKALQVYHLSLQLDPCQTLSGLAPNVGSQYAGWKRQWCQKNPKRCKLCTCKGPICPPKKAAKCPTCPRCPKGIKRPCPSYKACPKALAPPKPRGAPATLITGAVLSGIALVSIGVGTALFFVNEGQNEAFYEKVRKKDFYIDRDIATAEQTGYIGQGFLVVGGLSLTAGLIAIIVGATSTGTIEQKSK